MRSSLTILKNKLNLIFVRHKIDFHVDNHGDENKYQDEVQVDDFIVKAPEKPGDDGSVRTSNYCLYHIFYPFVIFRVQYNRKL